MRKLFLKRKLIKELDNKLAKDSVKNNLELQKAKVIGDKKIFNIEFNKRKQLYDEWYNKIKEIKDSNQVTSNSKKAQSNKDPLLILRIKGKNILSNKTLDSIANKRKKIISDFEKNKTIKLDFMNKVSDKITEYKLEINKMKKENSSQNKIDSLQERIEANKKLIEGNQEDITKLRTEHLKKLDNFDNKINEILRRLKTYNFKKGIYKK
jgi:hypothetical protein